MFGTNLIMYGESEIHATSVKCSGRIPDGPAPEPLGKERAAVATSGELKDLEGMTEAGGGG